MSKAESDNLMRGMAKNQKFLIPRKFMTLCGRILQDTDPQYFPRAQYRGRTIYFCTESCLGAFLADPDMFYNAHQISKIDPIEK
jgi:YHS domain-containing protein